MAGTLFSGFTKVSIVDPNGYTLKLDANRQAIADTFVVQLQDQNGALGVKTVYKVVGVPQTFGGAFSPTKPAPSGTSPACTKSADGTIPWKVTKV